MRWIWRGLLVVVLLVAVAAGWAAWRFNTHPSLAAYNPLHLPAAAPQAGALRVTYMGVSTLLLDDGETAIMTDGFFSRPGKLATLFGRVGPDAAAIEANLQRAGVTRLAAVIPVHSHYDHAMDSPDVALRTGALLVGSESTANIGRGRDLPADRIRVVRDGETLRFGRFAVTFVLLQHFPHPFAMGEITAPLRPPARSLDYKDGGSYAIFVEHDGRRLLIQGSAGFIDGKLRGQQAEVVFLGVGGLGTKGADYHDAYWREITAMVGARRVIPIHWDDFTRPLDQPLLAMPAIADDVPFSLDHLIRRGGETGVDIRMPPLWQPLDPFAGLK